MEFGVALVLASVAILATTLARRGLNFVLLRPQKLEKLLRQQGLSGNSYRFLFGDMIDLVRMKNKAESKPMDFSHDIISRVDAFIHHTIKTHGNSSFLWVGPVPAIAITDPDLITEIFSRIDEFPKQHFGLSKSLVPGFISYNGEKWAKHRKLINPAFYMKKLELMMPAFYTSCIETMNRWEKLCKSSSIELDVWPHLSNMTADAISRAAFGSNYVEGRGAFELIEEQTQSFNNGVKMSFIPGWRYMPTKANRRAIKVESEIREIIKRIVLRRMSEIEAGKATKNDLLGTLMEYCNYKEIQQERKKEVHLGLTVEEVIDECKLIYFVGHETTTDLLVFTMILLGRYTDWQARAREEVLEVFGDRAPDFDGLNQLKTVTMILYEVLRLYPPLTVMWRETTVDTKLRSLSLPAGVYLYVPVICSHHDPLYWGEDATTFNPERFSEGILKATKGKTSSFFPFGLGPRICIGQNFALTETKLALAMILQRFSFELSPSYTHAPSKIITIRPQFGAQLILNKL